MKPSTTSAAPKKKYLSYKELSTRFAITIPALKEHLRQAGWLVKDEPVSVGLEHTELRLGEYEGVGTRQWRWEESASVALLESRGLAMPNEFQKAAHVRSIHQAGDRLSSIGGKLFKLLEPVASKADLKRMDEATVLLEHEIAPDILWPAMEDPSRAPKLVEAAFLPFVKAAKRCLPPKHPKQLEIDGWLKSTTIIGLWLAKQKPQPMMG